MNRTGNSSGSKAAFTRAILGNENKQKGQHWKMKKKDKNLKGYRKKKRLFRKEAGRIFG